VVATASKALQDQLAAKDLPFLRRHLGQPFEWAVVKGRANYLCRQRIDEMSNEEYQALIRQRDGAELRRRLADVPEAREAKQILLSELSVAIKKDEARTAEMIDGILREAHGL
jgi:Rad3-related DNA helicase